MKRIFLVFLALVAGIVASWLLSRGISLIPDVGNLLIVKIVILAISVLIIWLVIDRNLVAVPETEVWLTTFFGKKERTLDHGLHLLGLFEKPAKAVVLTQRVAKIDLSEKGLGDVEFKDCSAGVKASLIFKVVDPCHFVYEAAENEDLIESIAASALRSNMEMYTMEEAISLKARFDHKTVGVVDNLLDPDSTPIEYEDSEFFRNMENLGIEILSLVVDDFVIPEDIKKARDEKTKLEIEEEKLSAQKRIAEKEAEIAKIKAEGEAKAYLIKAKAEAEALKEHGETLNGVVSGAINSLEDDGNKTDLAKVIHSGKALEEVAKHGGTVIVGGNGAAGEALAAFGIMEHKKEGK